MLLAMVDDRPGQIRIIHAVDPLVIVHVVIGFALVALAGVVGVWGVARARRIGVAGRTREARTFAQLLQRREHRAVGADRKVLDLEAECSSRGFGLADHVPGVAPGDHTELLQLVHTLVFAQVVIGLLMLVEGHRVDDKLHVNVYGSFMLVAIVASYAYRTKDATTNVRVFAGSSLVIFALGLRAMWTGT